MTLNQMLFYLCQVSFFSSDWTESRDISNSWMLNDSEARRKYSNLWMAFVSVRTKVWIPDNGSNYIWIVLKILSKQFLRLRRTYFDRLHSLRIFSALIKLRGNCDAFEYCYNYTFNAL